jgi:hypothetical protein
MHHIIELLFTKNKVKIKFSLFSFTNISMYVSAKEREIQ